MAKACRQWRGCDLSLGRCVLADTRETAVCRGPFFRSHPSDRSVSSLEPREQKESALRLLLHDLAAGLRGRAESAGRHLLAALGTRHVLAAQRGAHATVVAVEIVAH